MVVKMNNNKQPLPRTLVIVLIFRYLYKISELLSVCSAVESRCAFLLQLLKQFQSDCTLKSRFGISKVFCSFHVGALQSALNVIDAKATQEARTVQTFLHFSYTCCQHRNLGTYFCFSKLCAGPFKSLASKVQRARDESVYASRTHALY